MVSHVELEGKRFEVMERLQTKAFPILVMQTRVDV